jgi:anaerobic magnesium-protoporphyrin IX monomethyl ester cyclase
VFFTTVSYPIKGTPYFEDVSPRLVSLKSWAEASDRDYRIRGRHSRRFYQYADQLLRSEVELDRVLKGSTKDSGEGTNGAPVGELEKKIFEAREGLRASFTESEA